MKPKFGVNPMYRTNDSVRIKNRPAPGASIFGVIVAMSLLAENVREYTIKPSDAPEGSANELAMGHELAMVEAAPPLSLEGCTIRYADGRLSAATVTRVNAAGTTFDCKLDKATVRPRKRGAPATDAIEYDHEVDPSGEEITVSRLKDGNWYVRGGEEKVTLGVRETCIPIATTPETAPVNAGATVNA